MSKSKEETAIKFKYWSEVIHNCKNSGIPTRDWLIQNGIRRDTYYYWYGRIKKSAIQAVSESLPAATSAPANLPSFVEIPTTKLKARPDNSLPSSIPSATISINGMSIALSENASSEFITKLIGAISHAE